MKLGTDFICFAQFSSKFVSGNGRFKGTKPNPQDTLRFLDSADGIQQGKGRIHIPSVGAEMNAGQDDFTIARSGKPGDF